MRLVMVARNLREWAAWQTERQRLLALRAEAAWWLAGPLPWRVPVRWAAQAMLLTVVPALYGAVGLLLCGGLVAAVR